ncbi:ankyrin repeat domain-containing protein 26-like isoform X4 [Vicugna pacos]|uniref:Ankyrin repeat domain-containing protein 26-like isoform X4 n=1 Tax=Vicugna pacos TaxID=30538 RepID=A0ABM5BKP7_VICPA
MLQTGQTRIGGQQNRVVLQKLKPNTLYTITLSSLYPDVSGCHVMGRRKTKPLNTMRNLRVYDPATSTLNVCWDHAEGNPHWCKPFYALIAGGLEELVSIPGNPNDAILRNLKPDTPYTVTVVPIYPEGDGGRPADTGRTWNNERTGQKRPSIQSTKQPGCWLDHAPGRCRSTALCALPWLAQGPQNLTALHLACTSGQSSVVALLIQWKCDPNAHDKEGKTALIKAVQCRKEACVTILLKQGADPNLEDDCQNTALHYAALAGNTSTAAKLLHYNVNIEAINKYNFTPFLLAVSDNKEEMVKFLIENGANVHAVNKLQRSALMLAVHHDSPDIVKLLLQKHVNIDSQDFLGWSAERYACRNGFKHIYQLIVGYRDGKIPQNSDLGQSSAKERLPSSPTGAENIQEKLQLSSKDDEEMVVELGLSNGSRMDSLKNVEQKTDVVVEFSPSDVISISPKHDIEDSRPPSDDDLDVAPKVEEEENRSKSELKGSETMRDGSYHKGLTRQRKRGKTDDQQFPALQKGDSDSSCLGLHMKKVNKSESGKWTLKASVTSRVFAKTASLAGGLLHMNDSSSLSERGQGGGRSSKKMSTKKDKVKEKINSVDGLDDLTLSLETASEDRESLYPNCKNTLRLIEQLGPESKDSDRLLKIQDPVHSLRSIQLEKSDGELLRGKIKKMESKMNRLQTELLKTREAKSQLKRQNVDWGQELCSMRFTSKQETKKKKNAYILYDKSNDELKRKKKEYNEQVYLKQLESTARALECKLKSVKNKPNQVLEEQNDTQRQLSRAQNARVIQDEILAHQLSQQKEAEKANKKMNAEDTMDFELSDPKDNSEVLPQQISESESQFRGQEIELHPRRDALRPTMLVLECVHRDRGQAQCSNKETEPLSQSKQGKVNKYIGKQAFLEEKICELKSENMLLQQQLDVAQNEARSEKTILNIPEPFLDHMGKLEAMSRRVLMLEEGNKELINECRFLKDRLYQYETDRTEMEACMRQLQQELTHTRKKASMLEASLEVTAHHQTNVEAETQDSERKSHQTANPNADLPAKVESTSSVLLHLSAETQLFLKELLPMKELQKKSDTLEEEKKKLEEEVVKLRRHLEMNTVERSQAEQYKWKTEERARRDVVEKLKELSQVVQYNRETEARARQAIAEKLKEISQFLQAQAASQEDLLREYTRASVSQMEHRVQDLETKPKNKTFQFDSNERELERYKQLYLKELENRMSLASQLNSANKRLAAVSTELQLEKQHQSSLLGSGPTRPVDGPPSAKNSSTSVEPKRSLTQRRNFRNFSDPSTSMSGHLFTPVLNFNQSYRLS